MKKNWLKRHLKFIIGLVIGIALPGLVYAATILYASGEVSYDNSATGMSSTDVQGALDELYLLCKGEDPSKGGRSQSSVKKLSVGDYFTLEPDNDKYTIEKEVTGYSEDQKIVPNELTLWRVISINDDRTIDAVSEYVSSDKVYFEGTTGYANLVGGLQTIAEQYEVKEYTSSVRIFGFNDQTLTLKNTTPFDGTDPSELFEASDLTEGTGVESGDGENGDTLYLKDYLLVSELYQKDENAEVYCKSGLCAYEVDKETKKEYWLASRGRDVSEDPKEAYYTGRSINDEGLLKHNNKLRGYNISDDKWSDYSSFASLRPIITLYSTIKIDKGEGTKDKPYTLSK